MTGLWSIVSNLPAVFLLFTTVPGAHSNIHRCLREFDPSNCNALEEVWAFDAQGHKCIEMIYGGCGKPTHLANRFATRGECMKNCGKLMFKKSGKQNAQRASQVGHKARSSIRSENITNVNATHNKTALENIVSVLNDLGGEPKKQPQSNSQMSRALYQYPGKGMPSIFGRQSQPILSHIGQPFIGRPLSYGAQTSGGYARQLLKDDHHPPYLYEQALLKPFYGQSPRPAPLLYRYLGPKVYGLNGVFSPSYPIGRNPPLVYPYSVTRGSMKN